MIFEPGTRTQNNPEFMKFYNLYKSMIQRCYLKTSGSYPDYGAKGVTVGDEWLDLDDFFATIRSVDGFDFDKIMNGELQLDKDIKYKGNKVYSPKNCMFVTAQENCENRPSTTRRFVAVKPDYSYSTYQNVDKLCRENNLDSRHVWRILNAKKGTHLKWQFFYLDEFKPEHIVFRNRFKATSPDGIEHVYEKHSEFIREHESEGFNTPNILAVISGRYKHHKGWNFEKM